MVADLDRLAILAGRSWRATDLPGGLTNHNVRVTTDDDGPPLDVVVRCSSSDAGLLGIDRDAEHANTAAAAEAGVGAPVVEYRPDLGMLVIGFLPGRALDDADFADPGVMARAAEACRRLHAGPAVRQRVRHVRPPGGLPGERAGEGVPAAGDVHRPRGRVGRRTPSAGGRAAADRAVQQRPAGRQLPRRRRDGPADRLRVQRQQRRLLRARQHVDRVRLHAGADRGLDRGLLRHPEPRRPRPGPAAGAVQPVRLVAVGLHPGRHQPDRLRLPRVGDAPVREGRGDVPGSRTSARLLEDVARG